MWYAVDIRNLRFAELWRIAPGLAFLIAAVCKVLRIPIAVDTRVCMLSGVEKLDSFSLDSDVRGFLDPLVEAWRTEGFEAPFWYTIPMKGEGQRSVGCAMRSLDGASVAQCFFAEKRMPEFTKREVQSNVASAMGDGTFTGVTSGKRQMDHPHEFDGESLPGKEPGILMSRHRERLSQHRGSALTIRQGDVERFVVDLHNRAVRFHAERGVYVQAAE